MTDKSWPTSTTAPKPETPGKPGSIPKDRIFSLKSFYCLNQLLFLHESSSESACDLRFGWSISLSLLLLWHRNQRTWKRGSTLRDMILSAKSFYCLEKLNLLVALSHKRFCLKLGQSLYDIIWNKNFGWFLRWEVGQQYDFTLRKISKLEYVFLLQFCSTTVWTRNYYFKQYTVVATRFFEFMYILQNQVKWWALDRYYLGINAILRKMLWFCKCVESTFPWTLNLPDWFGLLWAAFEAIVQINIFEPKVLKNFALDVFCLGLREAKFSSN